MIDDRVKNNLDLLDKIVVDFMINNSDFIWEDLAGVAFVALCMASVEYPLDGKDFTSYAERKITKALTDFIKSS